MNSLAVPTCLARRQRNSGHVNWVVGKGKRTWGHWQHLHWCTPYTTEIHSLPMLSSLSLIIASSRWWLVKTSLKESIIVMEFMGQARVSSNAIIPESVRDNHHYIPLPLIPSSPYPWPSHPLMIYITCSMESLRWSSMKGWTPDYHSIIRMLLLLEPVCGYYMRASRDDLVNPLRHRRTLPCFLYAVATPSSSVLIRVRYACQ